MKRFFIQSMLILFMCASGALVLHAQALNPLSVSLTVSPQTPSVGQLVTFSTDSVQVDLATSTIRWEVDGELIDQGVGVRSVQTVASSESFQVRLSVTTQDGEQVSRARTVASPKNILLWEATDSYTPPFYKGKALANKTGDIKFSVINTANQTNSYSWEYNNQPQQRAGRDFFIAPGDLFVSRRLASVSVSDGNDSQTLSSSVQMNNPERISLYKQTQKLGTLYNTEVSTVFGDPQTLIAVPYFFPISDIESGDVAFTWKLNGAQAAENQNAITINPTPGIINVDILVENLNQVLQKAQRQITLQGF
jgi:hypothetical protein